MEQMEALKTEGARDKDLDDSAVADLALRRIFEAHFDEIRTDPQLTDEIFAIVSTQASPEELREIAAQVEKKATLL